MGNRFDKYFTKEYTEMVNKHKKMLHIMSH